MIRFFAILTLALCYVGLATAQQNTTSISATPYILRESKAPSQGDIPYPPSSGFIDINHQLFTQVTSGNDHIERIGNFPLGSKKVTLIVEEFDVLTKSSKVLSANDEGERDVSAPKHILLRCSIEGDLESRVYIAIFQNHCLGYIQSSDYDRILCSPVTTPQEVALADVRRAVNMFAKVNVPILGVVENMSGFVSPTGEKFDIFGTGGGEALAKQYHLPFLGSIPIDIEIRKGGDTGEPIALNRHSPASAIFDSLAEKICQELANSPAPALKIVN